MAKDDLKSEVTKAFEAWETMLWVGPGDDYHHQRIARGCFHIGAIRRQLWEKLGWEGALTGEEIATRLLKNKHGETSFNAVRFVIEDEFGDEFALKLVDALG